MGYGKINGSAWLDEDRAALSRRAEEGDLWAQIECAALNAEKNLAFLEEQAAKGSAHALINLGFIFSANFTRTRADGKESVLVTGDIVRAEDCFRRAAVLGSAWGMEILGTHALIRARVSGKAQDFLDAEKWLTSAAEGAEKPGSDLSAHGLKNAMGLLSELYADDSAGNPVKSEEKSREWKSRADAVQVDEE